MKYMHKYRNIISRIALISFLFAGSVTPAAAEYNPRTGKWMQRDSSGMGIVLQPNLPYNAANPIVTVSMAYELQFGDGMNFYEYLRSNAINRRDPSGLMSILESAWHKAASNWSGYLKTGGGRAWSQRLNGVQSASNIFGNRGSGFDADVYDVIGTLQNSKTETLQQAEKASFQLRYGHLQSMLFAAGNFEWDDFIWERDEAILFDLVGGGFFARACFVEGTQVLLDDGSTKSIEDVQIGTRVASWPDDPNVEIPNPKIEPDSWRLIRLVAKDDEHGVININLLRPLDWVEATGAVVGISINVSVEEIGIQGPATVTSIEPCPNSAAGPAAGIVTGTFATERSGTINVFIDSLDEPIGVTHQHPLYSVDRNSWVDAGSLQPGERIRTVAGEATVDRTHNRAEAESVFNLEIASTHTYFVSPTNVWAHNGCVPAQVKKSPRLFRRWIDSKYGKPQGVNRIAKKYVSEVIEEAEKLGFKNIRYEIGGSNSKSWRNIWHINMDAPNGGRTLHLLSEAP